jgi:hypothetical protein
VCALRGNDFRQFTQSGLWETGQVGWPDPDPMAQADESVVAQQLQGRAAGMGGGAALTTVLRFVAQREPVRFRIAQFDDRVGQPAGWRAGPPTTGPRGPASQKLWALLVRALPCPRRVQAALLLAVSAYTNGQVSLATAALRIALTDDPLEPTAQLLADGFACLVPAELIRVGQRPLIVIGPT